MSADTCIYPGCDERGSQHFCSHPDDGRCPKHHDVELQRRIAAVSAGASMMKALIDAPTRMIAGSIR